MILVWTEYDALTHVLSRCAEQLHDDHQEQFTIRLPPNVANGAPSGGDLLEALRAATGKAVLFFGHGVPAGPLGQDKRPSAARCPRSVLLNARQSRRVRPTMWRMVRFCRSMYDVDSVSRPKSGLVDRRGRPLH